jgi:RNA polymerase sigma factor (sigma-70 family)
MDHDTDLGGPAVFFPPTRCSSIRNSASSDPAVRRLAHNTLVSAYWKPVYNHIRRHWKVGNEDAKDLTQAFFARAMEKDFFAAFDPARSRFRSFMQTCVDRFVNNAQRDARRLKRGGQEQVHSLDFVGADGEPGPCIVSSLEDSDEYFRKEWVRGLMAAAIADLKHFCEESGKAVHYRIFERHDLHDVEAGSRPSYAALALDHGLTITQVTNFLSFARGQFRKRLLEQLQATTASDEEFREEVGLLFGRVK